MTKRVPVVVVALALLTTVLVLAGCVAKWTPEQGAALTATAASYLVPTPTPKPPASATPTAQAQPNPTPATTPSPAPASNLPAQIEHLMEVQ